MAKKRKAPSSQQTNQQKPKTVRKEVAEVVREEEESSNEEESEEATSSEEESESGSESEAEDGEGKEGGDEVSKRDLSELLEPFEKSQLIDLLKEAVAKDPKLLSKIIQKADSDPAHRKIFVFGLGWDATTEQLVQAFTPFGEIAESKLITDKNTGRAKGYAFVLFKTRAAAKKALKLPQKRIGNRTVTCQLASVGATAGAAAAEGGSRKMYVANVAPHVSFEKLKAFFGSFGEIEEGPSGMDPNTNKFKGFAIITYKSPEGYMKAMEEPIKMFENCQLHCKKFMDNNNANNPSRQSNATGTNPTVTDVNLSSLGINTGFLGSNLNTNGLLMALNPLAGNAWLAAGSNPGGLAAGYNPAALAAGYNQAASRLGSSMGGMSGGYGVNSINPTLAGNAWLAAGSNPAGLAAGYNPAALAAGYNAMGGMSGGYGVNSINPTVMGNYGSQEAFSGLGAYQNQQAGLSSIGTAGTATTATKVPKSGSKSGASTSTQYPSYFKR